MLQNQFDLVPVSEFFIEQHRDRSKFLLISGGVGILLIVIALWIVGRKVYKSLHKKHLNQYHKMKTKKKQH